MAAAALVRNTQPGPTVFSTEAHGTVIEWKGAGDMMGEDLQPVPEDVLQSVQFQRVVSRGILVLEEAPAEIERAFALHKQEWDDRMRRQATAAAAMLDQQPQNDMLMLACIATMAPGKLCGTEVPVRARTRNDSPPLCGLHRDLAPRFVSEVTEEFVDGKPVLRWYVPRVEAHTRQD